MTVLIIKITKRTNNLMMNYFLTNVDIRRCCDVPPDCRRMLARVVMCYHLVNSRRASEKARRNFRLSVSAEGAITLQRDLSEWLGGNKICHPYNSSPATK
jgi:hypothetical protein